MKLFTENIYYHADIHQNHCDLPYLVMFHGFMGTGHVFDHLTPKLKKFCNPVTIDLAGHGQSGGSLEPERYNTEKQIADLASIFNRLRYSEMILYGYSMGGRLALQFALTHTDLLDGLILESTTAGISEADLRSERRIQDQQRAKQIEDDYLGFLNRWMQKPLFTAAKSQTNLQKTYRHEMVNQNPGYIAASLKGFGSGSMQPAWGRLNKLDKPVLLVTGAEDKKFTTLNRSIDSKLNHSELIVINGAAHRVHLDQPEKLTNHIEFFIKTI